jgi:hypothetical protein
LALYEETLEEADNRPLAERSASLYVTGLSPTVAQTLAVLGVDLGALSTVGDLQGGLEIAERLLGYELVQRHGCPIELERA